jgi:hypothetical protein
MVRKYSLFILAIAIIGQVYSQVPEKIKVKKEDVFYFFPVKPKSDTITANQNDLFYLKVTGETRCTTRMEIVNGRLYKTDVDTIFRLKKVPNLQYEHYFMDSIFVANKPKTKEAEKSCSKFVTHINGAQEGDGNVIVIQFYNITTRETFLVKKYYYR